MPFFQGWLYNFATDCSFEDLLGYDNSVSVHQKNLQVLMIEMFKTKHGLNPLFMKEIFCPQTNQCSLRNDRDFNLPRVRLVMYGSETVQYRGPQLWCTLPVSIRHSTRLNLRQKSKLGKELSANANVGSADIYTTSRFYIGFRS